MDKIKEYCRKKRFLLLFLAVLFLFGLIVGLYLGIDGIEILKKDVLYYARNIGSQSYNYLLIHFFFLTISLVLSFFAIGIPLLCTILFYEGMCLGFLLGIFSLTYGVGGGLFAAIFFVLTKLFFVVILILFFLKCLEIARKMIGKYIYKTDPSIVISKHLKACFYLIGFVLIYDLFLIILGDKILPLFSFLIA